SDIYSLGATFYEMLTGVPPFRGDTLEVFEQIRKSDPVAPSQLQQNIPRDLQTICLKCLEKDPKKRYASAGDLADELARYQRGEPIRARRVTRLERGWRWCRRNKAVAASMAVVALVLVSATVVSLILAVQARNALAREEITSYH